MCIFLPSKDFTVPPAKLSKQTLSGQTPRVKFKLKRLELFFVVNEDCGFCPQPVWTATSNSFNVHLGNMCVEQK